MRLSADATSDDIATNLITKVSFENAVTEKRMESVAGLEQL
jgi:hypothetical protein